MVWSLVELLGILRLLLLSLILVQINLFWGLDRLEAVLNLIFLKLVYWMKLSSAGFFM